MRGKFSQSSALRHFAFSEYFLTSYMLLKNKFFFDFSQGGRKLKNLCIFGVVIAFFQFLSFAIAKFNYQFLDKYSTRYLFSPWKQFYKM